MRLILVFLLFAISSHYGVAQNISKVDFNKIKIAVGDSASNLYYPKILSRVILKDSTLNKNEFYHLYYGAVFQSYYHPYGTSNAKKKFLELYSDTDYTAALKQGAFVLLENPVDLEVLLKMSICCLKLDYQNEKREFAKLYYAFLDVIYASGNGNEISSAYVVTSVDHEYYIAGDLGLRVVHQELITDCDLLIFSKKGQKKIKGAKKIKELFFNVRMPLLSLSNTYEDADLPDPDED